MNGENNDLKLGLAVGFAASSLIFMMIIIAFAKADDREEEIRKTYVCLEPDVIPGRCLLGVYKGQQCWRFETAPDSKIKFDEGECVIQ